MLELTSAGQPVHLSPGTSAQLEYHSPLFDGDVILGQFSYSFTVPAPPNGPLYGFPERPDASGSAAPGSPLPAELGEAGLALLTGQQRVTKASPSTYTVSVQGGLTSLSERQLSSFAYGGLRAVPHQVQAGLDGGGNPQLVPGLVYHANEVVARPLDYDYVFAPLRNEYVPPPASGTTLPTPDPFAFPGTNSVNAWLVSDFDLFGLPAGGSFTYNKAFGGLGAPIAFDSLPPYCPFPKLRYVLRAICEEVGLVVDAAELLPGELGELVLVGNAQLVDRGDFQTLRFSLADVVPALTVAELLAAIRQDLGIVLYVDPSSQRVRTAYLVERVAAQAAYVDLTSRLAGYPEATLADPTGLTLTYGVAADDALTKDLPSQQPAASLVLAPVATFADLPTSIALADNPLNGQVRLVEETGTYFQCTLALPGGGFYYALWSELPDSLPAIAVNGGGTEQAQKLCYTKELYTHLGLDAAAPLVAQLPALSQPPYRADQAVVARSATLRLLFYNGLQSASDGVSRYPQLSHRSKSGALSVRLSGTHGTYAQQLRAWLAVQLQGSSYEQALLLTPLELARLDLTRPLRLDGVPYLVQQLKATAPLRKAASLTLVRLP
ncbi:MAG: hypothetical protein ACRYFK_16680 [Janthinobacterium lividum]